MSQKYNSQAGISTVAIVIAVVAVAVLGGGGYLAFKAHSKTPVSAVSTSSAPVTPAETAAIDQTTKSTLTPQGAYLDLAQAGVKIALNKSVNDAVYESSSNPPSGGSAFGISSQSIMQADNGNVECSAAHGPLGTISITSTPPMELVPPNGEKPMTPDNKTLFKVGNKYYQYIAPQEFINCGSVSSTQVEAAQQAVAQSFVSLQSDTSAQ
jgi:hypothetical protein